MTMDLMRAREGHVNYLDDPARFALDSPPWTRYFYAFRARNQFCTISEHGSVEIATFDVWPADVKEFPELAGVRLVALVDDGVTVTGEIRATFYGIFDRPLREGTTRLVQGGFVSIDDAYHQLHVLLKADDPEHFEGCPSIEPQVSTLL